MFKEALQIDADDSYIKKRIKQAIKDAKIAMITDDDLNAITQSLFSVLRAHSSTGPGKGDALKAKEAEQQPEKDPLLPDQDKTPAKASDIEKLKNYLGLLEFTYSTFKSSKNKVARKNELDKFNETEDEITKLFLDFNFKDRALYDNYYKISRAMRELISPRSKVKESLNVNLSDDDLGTIVYKAIKNADVSSFLRLSGDEIVRIAEQLDKLFRKLDPNYNTAEIVDPIKDVVQQTSVTESKEDEKDVFEKKNAGDVEKGIDIFNSSFGEEYSNKDAIYILNRLDEADRPNGAPIDFTEAPLSFDLEEDVDINNQTISYIDLKKEVDNFKSDLAKVDENDLDGVYSQYGYVYRTYRPLVDKCKDILRNISISGYGGIKDVEKVKIYELCKYMDYHFPFGWKMYQNR